MILEDRGELGRRSREEAPSAPRSSPAESARLSSMTSIGGAENAAYLFHSPPPQRDAAGD
jgi:hypothetical protein